MLKKFWTRQSALFYFALVDKLNKNDIIPTEKFEMEKLYIKDDVLHIDDGKKYYLIELGVIDLVSTDCFVISIKLNNGKQAFLHLENHHSGEEFDALAKILTEYSNFYQCSGAVVINLQTLNDIWLEEKPNQFGYYSIKLKFGERVAGVISKNLEGQIQTKNDIIEAKECFDATKLNIEGV